MAFYRDAFGFEPIGAPAEDGVPEPLQYPIGEQTRLMFVPTGGFGWALGDRGIAPSGTSECLLNTTVVTERDVTDLAVRAGRAGGEVISEPGHRPWGYAVTLADPDGHVWQITAASPAAS
ncbi:hypothetical protein GCM10027294_06010 [Marinactinospora endophytica]